MKLSTGLVGLPNAGKSTIFNLLTDSAGAEVANYAFCTIDPNTGFAQVYDPRLQVLAELVTPENVVPNRIQVVDIAGLVKGASEGEGLGSEFLSHIRSVTAIVQVVRTFEGDNIVHVDGSIDPARDLATVDTELRLADLEVLERAFEKRRPLVRQGNKEAVKESEMIAELQSLLDKDSDVRRADDETLENQAIASLNLLTAKPALILANSDEPGEANISDELRQAAGDREILEVCAALELEAAQLENPQEQQELLQGLGIFEQGLRALTRTLYEQLSLRTFFTVGPQELRAWSLGKSRLATDAAAAIHSDLRDGFIRADVIGYDEFVQAKSWQNATGKGAGALRRQGL